MQPRSHRSPVDSVRRHRRVTTILVVVFASALIALALAGIPGLAHAVQPPEPAPCVGNVVRVISGGSEIVKKANGRLCVRSAIAKPSRQMVRP